MGLLHDTPVVDPPSTFREFTAQALAIDPDTNLPQYLAEKWGMCHDSKPITDLAWLGISLTETVGYRVRSIAREARA